ncbi:hypothetical protein [Bradyrhizobium sp. HKCCYLS2033]|uniref:hypothetical protein n=1 Tax=Bradyrhizobium sp. HKCCYLS2033 TaxID=3420739 RepID=UPI003EBFEB29
MTLPDIYYVTVSVSAVAATVAFIISVVDQIRERRNDTIQRWQKAVVQQIFQASPNVLSFDEIAQRYRNEAVAFRIYNLKAEELSPQTLRLVILEMVQQDILEQRRGDKYSLKSFDSGIEGYTEMFTAQQSALAAIQKASTASFLSEMGSQMQTHINYLSRLSNEVFNLIGEEPFRYTISDISIRVSQKVNAPIDMIRGHVVELVARKMLQTDERGRLGLGTNADRSMMSDSDSDD